MIRKIENCYFHYIHFFPTAHPSSVLDTFYSTAFQDHPFFPTLWAAVCLKSGLSFAVQTEEGKIWKWSVLPHIHTHKPHACVGAQETPVAVQPPVHPPCTHPAAATRLDNNLLSPHHDPCWNSNSVKNRVPAWHEVIPDTSYSEDSLDFAPRSQWEFEVWHIPAVFSCYFFFFFLEGMKPVPSLMCIFVGMLPTPWSGKVQRIHLLQKNWE